MGFPMTVQDALVTAASLTALLLGAPSSAANLLENSSFELGLRGGWNVYAAFEQHAADEPYDAAFIDRTTAAVGEASARLSLGQNSLKYRPVALEEGASYTLSFFARCREDVPPPEVAVNLGDQKWRFRMPPDWQRYATTFRAGGLFEGTAWLIMLPLIGEDGESGPIWVDGVQLEEGDHATDYAPAAPVEFGLHTDVPCNIFLADEPVRIRLTAYNGTSERQAETIALNVVDHAEVPIWREPLTLRCPPGAQDFWVEPEVGRLGSFRAECTSAYGLWAPLVFARFPQTDPGPDPAYPLGVHISLDPGMLASAQRLGYKWVRLHDFAGTETKWTWVQPTADQFVWGDETVDRARAYGFWILGLFDRGADWTKERRTQDEIAKDLPQMRAWQAYVAETAAHSRGRIDRFEVLNENAEYPPYTELCKAAYEAAHRANPDVTMLGPCFHPANWPDRAHELLGQGILRWLDIWSFHYFDKTGPSLDSLVRAGRIDGAPRIVWNTEDNCGCFQTLYGRWANNWDEYWSDLRLRPIYSTRDQADWIAQNVAASLGHGIEKTFFYYNAWNPNLVPVFRSNSTREYDGAPRPIEVAYAAAGLMLNGAKPVGEPEVLPGIRTVLFDKNGQGLLAIWTYGLPTFNDITKVPSTADRRLITALRLEHLPGPRARRLREHGAVAVELPAPREAVRIRDCMLNPVGPLPGEARAVLPVSCSPLYVQVRGMSAEETVTALRAAAVRGAK